MPSGSPAGTQQYCGVGGDSKASLIGAGVGLRGGIWAPLWPWGSYHPPLQSPEFWSHGAPTAQCCPPPGPQCSTPQFKWIVLVSGLFLESRECSGGSCSHLFTSGTPQVPSIAQAKCYLCLTPGSLWANTAWRPVLLDLWGVKLFYLVDNILLNFIKV